MIDENKAFFQAEAGEAVELELALLEEELVVKRLTVGLHFQSHDVCSKVKNLALVALIYRNF